MMTAKRSFSSSFVRLAPLGLAAALAACGGGGGGGSSNSSTPVALTCPILSGASTGFTIGGCISGQTYGTASRNEQATVTFAGSNATLALSGALNTVPPIVFASTDLARTATGGLANTLGGLVAGPSFLERTLSTSPKVTSALGEFTRGVPITPAPVFGLTRARFGTWEYGTAAEGYFGTWFQGDSSTLLPNAAPTSGPATFSGYIVGYLWPIGPAAFSSSPLYGISGSITISNVNYVNRTYTVTINSLRGSQASPELSNFDLSGSLGSYTIANGSFPSTSSSFSGPLSGSNVAAGSTSFEAQFFGSSPTTALEIAGRLRLDTADGRRLVASFGAR